MLELLWGFFNEKKCSLEDKSISNCISGERWINMTQIDRNFVLKNLEQIQYELESGRHY